MVEPIHSRRSDLSEHRGTPCDDATVVCGPPPSQNPHATDIWAPPPTFLSPLALPSTRAEWDPPPRRSPLSLREPFFFLLSLSLANQSPPPSFPPPPEPPESDAAPPRHPVPPALFLTSPPQEIVNLLGV
uniref:Uncharacterized protein n=1 Tax=Oryza rufipogon TaxID=4529 RepID=A0A0E0P8C1_ORYRU